MSYLTVIGDRVCLYSYLVRETESKVLVCAKLPSEDWNGHRLNVLDWKIDDGETWKLVNGSSVATVLLRYMMSDNLCASIYDTRFPLVKDAFKLKRPNRSKNWKLDEYGDYWHNSKTGKKSYV
jgi:hypothetical protein